ncbi:hypothetical protein Celaphus_00013147 [Cervus elaphus hippelaphus]|uniref:Liprin-alpha CC2 domain-containing protein n=1 Tax=Cervus elaphus hippelaphus TaxID=46360 RepID=A0A212DH11_CEREH|nr:hypothetical protein Celaphus_00013147 [Cervus elaphus hippelaphus]
MTVVKRQAQSPAGVSSEVEVLKALKSLFEHHKALDEKVRERLRVALERCSLLEEELGATHKERSSDGSLSHEEDLAKVIELQEVIDKQSREQSQMKERLAALSAHVTELEEDLDTARKDLIKSEEVNTKLQRDVREAMAQKEDMEERITTLEKRYLAAQREATSVHDLNDKLENEIANKDSMHRQVMAFTELYLTFIVVPLFFPVCSSRPHLGSVPDFRFPVADGPADSFGGAAVLRRPQKGRLAALRDEPSKARPPPTPCPSLGGTLRGPAPHTGGLTGVWNQVLDGVAASGTDAVLGRQAEERHGNIEERLRQMEAQLEEKNQELQRVRVPAGRTRLGCRPVYRRVFALNVADEPRSSRAQVQTLNEQDWERAQQASVLANVAQAFESDVDVSDGEGDGATPFSSAALLSPSGQADAQTLAMMLQEQLDAINKEIRLIQEEKENTEQRAEEIESRVGSGSSDSLGRFRSMSSIPPYPASSLAGSSPPSSGRSTPRRMPHSPAREVDRLGIMTLVRVCLLPAVSLPQHTAAAGEFLFSVNSFVKVTIGSSHGV